MKKLLCLMVLCLTPTLVGAANKTIADLTARGTLEATDIIECEDVSPAGTFKCTLTEVQTLIDTDTKAVKEVYFSAPSLSPVCGSSTCDGVAPLIQDTGTNMNILVRAFDDTDDECVGGTFQVPSDLTSTGSDNVTLRLKFYAATGSTSAVYWDFYELERDTGDDWDDTAFGKEADGGCSAAAATQDELMECTWTETVTTLGWGASDTVFFEICRDGDHGSDALSGDAHMVDFAVEMIRE